MSLASSVTLIVTVILVYYALIKVFSILFRITGLPKEKAIFQSVSLLTNAGYTTGESELVVSEKTRRRIATASMLTGYFFSVVIAFGPYENIHTVFGESGNDNVYKVPVASSEAGNGAAAEDKA